MNSIIQCLSNTAYLAKYFIENAYEDDLNTNSDNETRGQIAVEFASVIKALWRGQYKSIAPHHLKVNIFLSLSYQNKINQILQSTIYFIFYSENNWTL